MARHTNAFPELQRDLRFVPLGVADPQVLTREQIHRYNSDGFLCPIDIFSAGEIADIRAYIDDLLPTAQAAGWGNYDVVNWHKTCRGIWDLVTEPRIIDVVADLLGDSVVLRHSHLFAKLAGDPKQVSWHQDASYWPLTPSRVVSAWLAIDESDVANSAMRVIPGSHHHAQLVFHDSDEDEDNVLFQTVRDAEDWGRPPVSLELRAGQISLHSDWILHSSAPNRSDRRRCGLAMRYLSAEVRAYDGWNAHSVWCRGVDPRNHWANHPRPWRVFTSPGPRDA
ncbi:MAG: phytanoyl-CoA dioxygenase family protein [Acidimicrobiia bacterium]|nr:phytanoyl-CoA dioxygenase family protein [Acidimicrobiia bacterium]